MMNKQTLAICCGSQSSTLPGPQSLILAEASGPH